MKNLSLALLISVSLTGPTSFAFGRNKHKPKINLPEQSTQTGSTQTGIPPTGSTQSGLGLTWNDFRESCTNPAKFHAQKPPENIKVICKEVRQLYVPIESGSFTLPAYRTVKANLLSDKFFVSYNAESIGANGLKVACPRLKEVEETLVTERMVTCDEILGNVSSLNNLCVSFIDSARQDNVNLATVQDTGETISSCEQ